MKSQIRPQAEKAVAAEERARPRCFLALPLQEQSSALGEAIRKGVNDGGFKTSSLDEMLQLPLGIREMPTGELARADCVIADLTEKTPNVFFEVGMAQAMGKPLFLLVRRDLADDVPTDLRGFQYIAYQPTARGLSELSKNLAQALREYRRHPVGPRPFRAGRLATPFFVDWDRLDPSEAENLCLELLAQMGYQRVDWIKEPREFDLVAELPKKDPDGFEYRELWLVAMGRHAPPQMLLEMASHEPDFFLHRFLRDEERLERLTSRGYGDVPITLLVILLKGEYPGELLEGVHSRVSRRAGRGPLGLSLRLRVWDRKYLTSLVQQFPQIGYKYFSDEGRSLSKYRKSPDELYQETIALNERLAATVAALEDEKNRRVRAERDAIWKDVSFSAAHKIGNPIFAIETNLDPLKKRIVESRTGEAMEVAASIAVSVEKAKAIIDQFKSLTRAQQITPVQTLLRPVLEDACRMARNQGVTCEIECPADVTVRADPDRLTECFDELASNAMNWFDKPEKKIAVQVVQPAPQPLPESVDSSQQYTLIDFRDTGAGVPVGNKSRIFDAFVTTRDHGTGLGLAVVRRIIEGHGGVICESGTPGQGAHFEIYLPVAGEALAGATRSPNHKE